MLILPIEELYMVSLLPAYILREEHGPIIAIARLQCLIGSARLIVILSAFAPNRGLNHDPFGSARLIVILSAVAPNRNPFGSACLIVILSKRHA